MVEFLTLGTGLPWAAAMTGDGQFPHNGRSTTDVTVSVNTTWDDTDYPGRIVQLRKLTINAGITLTLEGGPWFLFVDEIAFGDASSRISGDGPDGDISGAGSSTQAASYARGGAVNSGTGYAEGGAGGVMVFVVVREISGAAGVISANGGDGDRNTTDGSSSPASGGEGALSALKVPGDPQNWSGTGDPTSTSMRAFLHPLQLFMGAGGGSSVYGGGSAATNGADGGSGIGGGGGGATSGALPHVTPNPAHLIELALVGCKGGGGGGAQVLSAGNNNRGGGGGGGAVCVWVRTLTATPTIEANGGTGAADETMDGAAGVTYLITVP